MAEQTNNPSDSEILVKLANNVVYYIQLNRGANPSAQRCVVRTIKMCSLGCQCVVSKIFSPKMCSLHCQCVVSLPRNQDATAIIHLIPLTNCIIMDVTADGVLSKKIMNDYWIPVRVGL